MESLREVIYLVASSLISTESHRRDVTRSPATPQGSSSSSCCHQIQRLFDYHDQHALYTNSISSQNGESSPSSVSSSFTPSSSGATTPPADLESSFIYFPQLPMEIRSQIWRIASQSIDGRVIPIEPDDEFEDAGRGFQCRARIGTPSIFSTCSESRTEALRFYELKFHAQLRNPVYFNSEKDILFMSRTSSMFSFLQSTYEFERVTHDEYDRNEVQNLALLVNDTEVNFWGEDSLHGYPSWRQVSMAAITFANLREIRLIYRRENNEYTPEFQREKVTLAMFWTRHWSSWQDLRARAVQMTQNLVLHPRISKAPEIVFWSREELETQLPTRERWLPQNFQRRSRGSPEPLYGRNQNSFFQGFS